MQNSWHVFANSWIGDRSRQLLLILTIYILVLLVLALGLVILTVYLHRANAAKAEKWKALEHKWNPLISAVIAGFLPPQSLVEKVEENEKLFFVDYLMRYISKLEGDTKNILCNMALPYLEQLVSRMKTGDEEQRARAILTLSTMGFETYQHVVVQAIDDPSPVVAMLASRSLADKGAIQYLDLVLSKIALFRSWSPHYLSTMLESLARSQPTLLLKRLRTHAYPKWVQAVILKALSQLHCSEALPVAADLLKTESDRDIQVAALQLLAQLGHSEYRALVRSKTQHPDFVIRLHAIKALSQIGDQSDAELFTQCLEDNSQWVALHAAEALKNIGKLDVLEQFADSGHPHAELALQVLYDQDSVKELELAARSIAFVVKVPQWLRFTYRRASTVAWRRVSAILFQPETHPEVRLAIAAQLKPDPHHPLYQEALNQLFSGRWPDPVFLIKILYQLRPEQALDTLSQFFFQTPLRSVQEYILKLFQQDPRGYRDYSNFIQQASHILRN